MEAIARLKAVLGLDAKAYKAGMGDASRSTQKFQSDLKRVGSMIGVSFSAAAVIGLTKSLVSFASSIRHSADNLEITTASLQGLNALALKYGVTTEQVSKSLAKLLVVQGEVAAGSKTYNQSLENLGINLEEFINLAPDAALESLAKAYKNADNQQQAFADVAKILGERIGPRLTAMLKELADDGLESVIQKSRTAGQAIEDDMITKLEALGTKTEQTSLKIKVAWAEIMAAIGDGASAIGGQLGEASAMTGGAKGYLKALVNPIEGVKWVANLIKNREKIMQAGADQIVTVPEKTPEEIKSGLKEPKRAIAQEPEKMFEGVDADAHVLARSAMMEKKANDLQREIDKINQEIESAQDKGSAISQSRSSQGIRTDAIASVGGMIGGQRAGVAVVDRQMKMQAESLSVQRKIAELTQRLVDAEEQARTNL
jgi:ABC-type Fe3+-hydroxamate transport system substrate-binding protein